MFYQGFQDVVQLSELTKVGDNLLNLSENTDKVGSSKRNSIKVGSDFCWLSASNETRLWMCKPTDEIYFDRSVICHLELIVSSSYLSWSYKCIFYFFLIFTGTAAYDKLKSLLTSKVLLRDIEKLSPDAQTSCLEGFHATLNHWHPKMIGFSWLGSFCRYAFILMLHFRKTIQM